MGLTAGRFTLRRARGTFAGYHAKGERKNGKTTHLISFLPPAPEVLTILTRWLTPTRLPPSGKHIDFLAFRGFLRAEAR